MASVPRPAGTPHTSGAHPDIHAHRILILDFGAQYTQLIARRVRELGVYCEIHPWDVSDAEVRGSRARGVILPAGRERVPEVAPPRAPPAVYELGVPVLGICYGMQTMAQQLGGRVTPGVEREFGYAEVTVTGASRLLDHLQDRRNPAGAAVLDVWMSHGDRVDALPQGFVATASTGTIAFAAMADERRRFYGVQFHPEVTHTPQGARLLERFVREICATDALWSVGNIIEDAIARVRAQVGRGKVLLGLSGGVDSSVVAALLQRAIGEQLVCVFVDHGLLRLGEAEQVMSTFAQHLGVRVVRVDAQARFLTALAGVTDPEAKRKIIGRTFVDVFDEQAQRLSRVQLAGPLGGRHGGWRELRLRDRAARGGDGGLHDRPLGAPAVRVPRRGLEAHRERGPGHLARGLRHLGQAAGDDRVGVEPTLQCPSCGAPGMGRFWNRCGEKRHVDHDFSLRSYLAEAFGTFTQLDSI